MTAPAKRTLLVTSALAVCQRRAAPRAHRRVRPDRHLGALPAHARPRLPVHLGERRARHADHAQGAAGRHHARATDRARRCRATPRLRRVRHLVRQLPHHALGREPRSHLRDLSSTRGGRPHPARDDRAGVRRAGEDVPAGSLRAGHMPQVRRTRPVRRQLRSLRRHLHAGGPAECRVGRERHRAGAEGVGAPVLQARQLRADAARLDAAANACSPPSRQSSASGSARACATGTFRATSRTSASRFRARPASISTSGSTRRSATCRACCSTAAAPGAISTSTGSRTARPRCITSSARTSSTSTRCSGRPCCGRGLPSADVGVRARLPDRERTEDVQVARHADLRPHLARSPAGGVPALLLRLAPR